MAEVFVSIGSNVDRARNLAAALERLRGLYGDLRVSGVYESDPVGFDGSPFYNVAVGMRSEHTPEALVAAFRALESECGRARDGDRYGPRTLDVDLLLYGDLVIERNGLKLPRDEILSFAFVLAPLAEIAGGQRHPVEGTTFAELWARFDEPGQGIRRLSRSAEELIDAVSVSLRRAVRSDAAK